MTTAIETLALNLEAATQYKEMQHLLKVARDAHKVALECPLNKSMIVLKQECERVAKAIRNGTVKEASPVQKPSKPTAAKVTTHTIDMQDKAPAPSQPKQVSMQQQLAEAKAEINRLRQELADKTNEVAEYSEALAHARETISNQANVIKQKQESVTVEVPEPSIAEAVQLYSRNIGLQMLGDVGNYRITQESTGLMLTNKLETAGQVLRYLETYAKQFKLKP